MPSRVKANLRNSHTWFILLYLFACSILYHASSIKPIASFLPGSFFGLAEPTLVSILFLVPIIYAGFVFGFAGGISVSLISAIVMLPRALSFVSEKPDALLDTAGVILVGILTSLLFGARMQTLKAQEQRRLALEMSELAQRKLRSQVRATMEHQERLTTISAISSLLSQALEPDQTLRTAIDRLTSIIRVDAVAIFLCDRRSSLMTLTANQGISSSSIDRLNKLQVTEVLPEQSLTGSGSASHSNEHKPRMLNKILMEERLQSQLVLPMRARGTLLGAICVARRQEDFSIADVELIGAISNEIGVALENAHLYQEQLTITNQLELSEKRYRELFERAQDAIWVHDLDGNIISANEAAGRLTGYDLPELQRMNVKSFLSGDSLQTAKDIRNRLINSVPVTQPYEQKMTTKMGAEAILKLSTNIVNVDGKVIGFQNIARDVTKERRMEENLTFYLEHITNAQEEERKRISREIHDSTAQTLIAMLHQLEDFLQSKDSLHMGDTRVLWNLHEELRTVLQEVRQFARDLRPSILDDLGLLPSLEWLCSEMKKESGIDFTMQVIGDERVFPPEVSLTLFRISQEAMRNIAKHSSATTAQVTTIFDKHAAKLIIEDNGKGFDLPKNMGDLARFGKLGLAGMQERARLLGASLDVKSGIGKGTRVTVELPL